MPGRSAESRENSASKPLAACDVPAPVLVHWAVQRHPVRLRRQAIESYWRTHPVRADRLARALAARSGTPDGWSWRLGDASFRMPPAPFRDPSHARGPGFCCICGQAVFRFGWHVDLWADNAPNTRAFWHACCVQAWRLWTQPNQHRRSIGAMQRRRCAETGRRLLRTAEVDHRVALYRVWRDHRDAPWPELLRYWGVPNLQVLNKPAHLAKSNLEAGDRGRLRRQAGIAPGVEQSEFTHLAPIQLFASTLMNEVNPPRRPELIVL